LKKYLAPLFTKNGFVLFFGILLPEQIIENGGEGE
jgi:hypothetical protein